MVRRIFTLVALTAVACLGFALTFVEMGHAAEAPVGLGAAKGFAVLGSESVTNTGPSTINADVGVSPGTSITGFPPAVISGGVIHATDAVAAAAKIDLNTAYGDAAGRTPTAAIVGDLGGQTLVGGVYNGGNIGLTGTLILDGQNNPDSVWIFQAASGLTTASTSGVSLINGANACNVFWQITSSAVLGSGSQFVGTVMANTSIAANTGATIQGRLLVLTGSVTLDTNTFVGGPCSPGTTTDTGVPVPVPTTIARTGTRTDVLRVAYVMVALGVLMVVAARPTASNGRRAQQASPNSWRPVV